MHNWHLLLLLILSLLQPIFSKHGLFDGRQCCSHSSRSSLADEKPSLHGNSRFNKPISENERLNGLHEFRQNSHRFEVRGELRLTRHSQVQIERNALVPDGQRSSDNNKYLKDISHNQKNAILGNVLTTSTRLSNEAKEPDNIEYSSTSRLTTRHTQTGRSIRRQQTNRRTASSNLNTNEIYVRDGTRERTYTNDNIRQRDVRQINDEHITYNLNRKSSERDLRLKTSRIPTRKIDFDELHDIRNIERYAASNIYKRDIRYSIGNNERFERDNILEKAERTQRPGRQSGTKRMSNKNFKDQSYTARTTNVRNVITGNQNTEGRKRVILARDETRERMTVATFSVRDVRQQDMKIITNGQIARRRDERNNDSYLRDKTRHRVPVDAKRNVPAEITRDERELNTKPRERTVFLERDESPQNVKKSMKGYNDHILNQRNTNERDDRKGRQNGLRNFPNAHRDNREDLKEYRRDVIIRENGRYFRDHIPARAVSVDRRVGNLNARRNLEEHNAHNRNTRKTIVQNVDPIKILQRTTRQYISRGSEEGTSNLRDERINTNNAGRNQIRRESLPSERVFQVRVAERLIMSEHSASNSEKRNRRVRNYHADIQNSNRNVRSEANERIDSSQGQRRSREISRIIAKPISYTREGLNVFLRTNEKEDLIARENERNVRTHAKDNTRERPASSQRNLRQNRISQRFDHEQDINRMINTYIARNSENRDTMIRSSQSHIRINERDTKTDLRNREDTMRKLLVSDRRIDTTEHVAVRGHRNARVLDKHSSIKNNDRYVEDKTRERVHLSYRRARQDVRRISEEAIPFSRSDSLRQLEGRRIIDIRVVRNHESVANAKDRCTDTKNCDRYSRRNTRGRITNSLREKAYEHPANSRYKIKENIHSTPFRKVQEYIRNNFNANAISFERELYFDAKRIWDARVIRTREERTAEPAERNDEILSKKFDRERGSVGRKMRLTQTRNERISRLQARQLQFERNDVRNYNRYAKDNTQDKIFLVKRELSQKIKTIANGNNVDAEDIRMVNVRNERITERRELRDQSRKLSRVEHTKTNSRTSDSMINRRRGPQGHRIEISLQEKEPKGNRDLMYHINVDRDSSERNAAFVDGLRIITRHKQTSGLAASAPIDNIFSTLCYWKYLLYAIQAIYMFEVLKQIIRNEDKKHSSLPRVLLTSTGHIKVD